MSWDHREVAAAFSRAEVRLAETALSQNALLVESLDSTRLRFAAVDVEGAWALVIVTTSSARAVPALRLSLLSADYGAGYELQGRESIDELRVCVIRCFAHDSAMQSLFATVCAALLESLPVDPSDEDVETEVAKWVSLFWRLQTPPRSTVVGLIGELTLLDSVHHLTDWVRAWRADPTDNLDFAFAVPILSVEVKATSSQQRVHELSIHQALPIVSENHFFASVIVELRAAGERLGDVVAQLAESLAGKPEVELFWRAIADVAGASLSEYLEVRYMRDVARGSLKFYAAGSVPRPEVEFPLPAGVSAVRFRSDFSSVGTVDQDPILGLSSGR